jgi:glycosyltransferase involved in cell wall biosynthesis
MIPKISIITPCFNAIKYIEQMILSVIDQEYENLEFIIIDGESTDGTIEIIKKYEDKITYWISEQDKGQSDAINKGIAVATGYVFNWVNADDFLETGALKKIGEYFSNPETRIVCTQTTFLNPDNSTYTNTTTEFEGEIKEVLNTRGLNQMGMYWKMDLIKQLNGVNTAFRYAMDLDLWKRYLLTFGDEGIVSDQMITGVFRLHADSKTGIDMSVNASFFDKENNAALIQYARVAGNNYVRGIRFLYSSIDEDLAKVQPISTLPVESIKNWMNDLFYYKAKRYFYANEFKNAYALLKEIEVNYLSPENKKNAISFRKWSMIKRFLK